MVLRGQPRVFFQERCVLTMPTAQRVQARVTGHWRLLPLLPNQQPQNSVARKVSAMAPRVPVRTLSTASLISPCPGFESGDAVESVLTAAVTDRIQSRPGGGTPFWRRDGLCRPTGALWRAGHGAVSGGGFFQCGRVRPQHSPSGVFQSYPATAAGQENG